MDSKFKKTNDSDSENEEETDTYNPKYNNILILV